MQVQRSWPAPTGSPLQRLDLLPHMAAVLDARGIIRAVNAAWRAAADEGVPAVLDDYLGALRAGEGPVAGRALAELLAELLDGTRSSVELEYAAPARGRERWLLCTATPCLVDGQRGVVVQHEDVTAERAAATRRALATAVGPALLVHDPAERVRAVVSAVAATMRWPVAALFAQVAAGRLRVTATCALANERAIGVELDLPPALAGVLAENGAVHLPVDSSLAEVARAVGAWSLRGALAVTLPTDAQPLALFFTGGAEQPPREVLELVAALLREEPAAPVVESVALARLDEHEREHIIRVLRELGYNMRQAARTLGISRTTLYDKLRVYDIDLAAIRRDRAGRPSF